MKRFLMFFIVFIGLASFSNAAEIFVEGETTLTYSKNCGTSSKLSTIPTGHTLYTIQNIMNPYFNALKTDPTATSEEFISLMEEFLAYYNDLYDENFDGYYAISLGVNSKFYIYLYNKVDVDILAVKGSGANTFVSLISFEPGSNFVCFDFTYNNVQYDEVRYYTNTLENTFFLLDRYTGTFSQYPFISNTSIKLSTDRNQGASNNTAYTYSWDGESYRQKIDEPDTPSSIHDLAGLISAITTSDVIKDNIDDNNLEYFIIYTGEAFGDYCYDIYFYDKRINLSYFEYLDENEWLRYDLNKMSVDGVINKIIDFLPFTELKCQRFAITYNPETGDSWVGYGEKKNFNKDLEGFSVELTPLVYTSKDIPYYFYEYDEITNQGIATPDTDKDIKTQVITDSEGNEISTVVTPSSSLIGETTWNKVLNAILSIPESILAGIKKLFIPDLSYLEGTMENLKNKLGFITQAREIVEDITNGIELNPTAPPSISIDLTNANSKYNWGTQAICIDLSWYEPFKPAVDFLIICFCYGFFFWNLFRKLPDIINGVAGDVPMMSYQADRVSNNAKRESIGFKTK